MSGFDWESYVPGETTIFVMEGGVPYKCKVLSVTEETMKLHYVGFNKRYDEWLPVDSPRIVNGDAVSDSVLVEPVGAQSDLGQCLSGGGASVAGAGSNLLSGKACAGQSLRAKRARDDDVSPTSAKRPSIQYDVPLPILEGNVTMNGSDHSTVSASSVNVVRRSAVNGDGVVRSAEELIDSMSEMLDAESDFTGNGGGSSHRSPPVTGSSTGNTRGVGESVGNPTSVSCCGFCSLRIRAECITCDRCRKVFHAETICLGTSESVIKAILDVKDGALLYVCCGCRSSDGGSGIDPGSGSGGFNQLMVIVQSMVAEIRGLKDTVQGVHVGNLPHAVPEVGEAVVPPSMRPMNEEILNSVREINEREKRKHSVVLRGFGNLNNSELLEKFKSVCRYLGVGQVSLSNIVQINNTLFRGTILNVEDKMRLLSEAKKLRYSEEYGRVFIQRDLTYLQRQDLNTRRNANREYQDSEVVSTHQDVSSPHMNFSSVVQGNPPSRGRGAHGYTPRGRGVAGSSGRGLSGVVGRRSFSVVGRGGSNRGNVNHEPLGVAGRGFSANDVSAAIGNGSLPPGRGGMAPQNGRGANSSRGSRGISSVPHLRRNSHLN